jgi:hypothetical protein
MEDFERRKIEILQPIYFEAGAALYDCQAFEFQIGCMLLFFARFGTVGLDPDGILAILDGDAKKTAGQLIKMLKDPLKVSAGIETALAEALDARNNIVHRFLIANLERLADPACHRNLIRELRLLRGKVQAAVKKVQPFVAGLAEALTGIDGDQVRDEARRRLLSRSTDG